jgi:Asp-tRNA(Asn)/Glu-tRNA(Gln) amidotransferase B subunit
MTPRCSRLRVARRLFRGRHRRRRKPQTGVELDNERASVALEDHESISGFVVTPAGLASLLRLIENGTISGKIAKAVFEEMVARGADPERIVAEKGLTQVTDAGAIEAMIDRVDRRESRFRRGLPG